MAFLSSSLADLVSWAEAEFEPCTLRTPPVASFPAPHARWADLEDDSGSEGGKGRPDQDLEDLIADAIPAFPAMTADDFDGLDGVPCKGALQWTDFGLQQAGVLAEALSSRCSRAAVLPRGVRRAALEAHCGCNGDGGRCLPMGSWRCWAAWWSFAAFAAAAATAATAA